jgi:Protein of unknown function (DUF2934)
MLDIEQATRERAYQLWIESGCQDGHADTHWLAAQREVLGTFLGSLGRVTISEQHPETSAKPKKVARKKRAA